MWHLFLYTLKKKLNLWWFSFKEIITNKVIILENNLEYWSYDIVSFVP
jgi:uncharacterized protein YydD (DUF2326 family)